MLEHKAEGHPDDPPIAAPTMMVRHDSPSMLAATVPAPAPLMPIIRLSAIAGRRFRRTKADTNVVPARARMGNPNDG